MKALATIITPWLVATALAGCSDAPSGGGDDGGSGGRGGAAGSGGVAIGTTAGASGASASSGAPGGGAAGAGSSSGGNASGTGGTAGGPGAGSAGSGASQAGMGGAGGSLSGSGGQVGGGGSGAGGDGGSTPGFAPCPATGDCVIMPLGDSITDGFGTPGGYRIELFRTALMNGRHVTFAGRNMNGPNTVTVGATTTDFPKGHEGYSGYTIDPSSRSGISPLVDAAISAAKPHIILLMIGTNDIDLSVDVATAPMRLGALLDKLTSDAPNALVVLAQITPLQDDTVNSRVRTYNDALPGLVQSRVAAGKHILLVDMYAPFVANSDFKTALLADKWHPNPAGYQVMSTVWYDAIKNLLH